MGSQPTFNVDLFFETYLQYFNFAAQNLCLPLLAANVTDKHC